MIKISFSRDGETISLRVNGHAGQAEMGQDIVCASASILAYTVAQTLQYIDAQGGLKERPHLNLKSGYAEIICKPTEEYAGEVLQTFFVAEVGYTLLAHNYPQYVELKMFGETARS